MLDIELQDNASTALAVMPDRLRQALSAKANELTAALQARIQQKLAGEVLNARTGALARAITATIDDDSANVAVTVAVYGDIKYAAIHEFCGTIPPHEILPDKARALAFPVGGKRAFAMRVNLPAIAMPQRSYLRSSLAETADEIEAGMAEAVVEALG
jgi:phage gpG-like protein